MPYHHAKILKDPCSKFQDRKMRCFWAQIEVKMVHLAQTKTFWGNSYL